MQKKQLKILIAPLDWGFGHTTRCMPIVAHLRARGHKVFFAGTPAQNDFAREMFPDLHFLRLPEYEVRYSRNKNLLALRLLLQLPRLLSVVRKEKQILKTWIDEHRFDYVISDNRYGLYDPRLPCFFITHQLQILSGKGSFFDNLLRRIHYRAFRSFDEIWVPDVEGADGLAGILSHPKTLPEKPLRYIGFLSRFAENETAAKTEKHFVVLLSGVEPQRSILQKLLWEAALEATEHTIHFIAGSKDCSVPEQIPQHVRFHKTLYGSALQTLLCNAVGVVCRSGYSSLMDLRALNKPALLIPTPGQTEQVYLAEHLNGRLGFYSAEQGAIDLRKAFEQLASASPKPADTADFALFKSVLNEVEKGRFTS